MKHAACVLVIATWIGCGKDDSAKPGELTDPFGASAPSSQDESKTPTGTATVELKDGKMTVSGPGGQHYELNHPGAGAVPNAKMTIGNAKVPDGFPLPIIDGAKLNLAQEQSIPGSAKVIAVAFESDKSVEDVAAYYEKAMKDKDMKLHRTEMTNEGTHMVMMGSESPEGQINATIVRAEGESKTTVSLGWQAK